MPYGEGESLRNKRLHGKMPSLQLGQALSNKTPLDALQSDSCEVRCMGSPSNYCFPYYFPNSYTTALKQNPALLAQAQATKSGKH